jgi:hypothetical protein
MLTVTYLDRNCSTQSLTFDNNDKLPRALTQCVADRVEDQWWRYQADFLWWDGRRVLRFRRGYGWDGASVPTGVRWYCNPGDYPAATGPHDYGYGYHWLEVWDATRGRWAFVKVTKREMDALWWQILDHHYRVRITKRFVLWEAVRVFGWGSWLSHGCNGKCKSCDPLDNARDCPYEDVPPQPSEFIKE